MPKWDKIRAVTCVTLIRKPVDNCMVVITLVGNFQVPHPKFIEHGTIGHPIHGLSQACLASLFPARGRLGPSESAISLSTNQTTKDTTVAEKAQRFRIMTAHYIALAESVL
eukprot:TRINITY_DN70449_c0_g1_i1.p1 TRINITY_DN70449_c0_g1~~TRINITY_DN70449_c0_g1_i1.p1  ORF type:complete len:111 (+),score=6.61 TRINITY_DN70449_c0_g1_i1:1-333(+)